MALSRVRFTSAAAGDGIDRELFFEKWLHEVPVGLVVTEGAVHEQEGRPLAALLVRDCGTSR